MKYIRYAPKRNTLAAKRTHVRYKTHMYTAQNVHIHTFCGTDVLCCYTAPREEVDDLDGRVLYIYNIDERIIYILQNFQKRNQNV